MNKYTFLLLISLLTACGDQKTQQDIQTHTPDTSADDVQAAQPVQAAKAPKTAGEVDFPALPIILVPDIIGTSAAQAQLETQIEPLIKPMSGITVRAAQCDTDGHLINSRGIFNVDDASGRYTENSEHGLFFFGS